MRTVFLYGPLRDAELRRALVGDVATTPAALRGMALFQGDGGGWPVVSPVPGALLEGLRAELDDEPWERLSLYLAAVGADEVHKVTLDTGDEAELHVRDGSVAGDWSYDRWLGDNAVLDRAVATEAMEQSADVHAAELAFRLPTLRQRVESRLRAAAHPTPTTLRADIHRDAVKVFDRRQPYVHFFAVEEAELVYPHFAGGASARVNRAAFVSGDTVAVLPYDPVRDRVLLVEQFRFGAFARGDPYPWVLEPIAGRIDAGEAPEAAAHRETAEEAGLSLRGLERVAAAYPSPGQITEYLHVYVGLADLPDSASGLGGLDAENEDIRAHVLSFDGMMSLAARGEIGSMPLLMAAYWLEGARREGRLA